MRLPLLIPVNRSHWLARWLCRGDFTALRLAENGQLVIEWPDGGQEDARVLPGTMVFPCLVVMRLRFGGGVASLVLPEMATGAAAHRRLRVWLRWCAGAPGRVA